MGIGSWNPVVRHLPGAHTRPRSSTRIRAGGSAPENGAVGGSNNDTKPLQHQEHEDEDHRAEFLKARRGLIEALEQTLTKRSEIEAGPVPAPKPQPPQPPQGGMKQWLRSIDYSVAAPWVIGGAVVTGLFLLICFAIIGLLGQ